MNGQVIHATFPREHNAIEHKPRSLQLVTNELVERPDFPYLEVILPNNSTEAQALVSVITDAYEPSMTDVTNDNAHLFYEGPGYVLVRSETQTEAGQPKLGLRIYRSMQAAQNDLLSDEPKVLVDKPAALGLQRKLLGAVAYALAIFPTKK